MSNRTIQKKAVRAYRRRLKERGLVRLEVKTAKEDAPLLRQVAKALWSDPVHAAKLRSHLHRLVDREPQSDLKALLASAPLEGIDLSRRKDTGREVDL